MVLVGFFFFLKKTCITVIDVKSSMSKSKFQCWFCLRLLQPYLKHTTTIQSKSKSHSAIVLAKLLYFLVFLSLFLSLV